MVGPKKFQLQQLKAQLVREFDTKDFRATNKILRMQIYQDKKERRFGFLKRITF